MKTILRAMMLAVLAMMAVMPVASAQTPRKYAVFPIERGVLPSIPQVLAFETAPDDRREDIARHRNPGLASFFDGTVKRVLSGQSLLGGHVLACDDGKQYFIVASSGDFKSNEVSCSTLARISGGEVQIADRQATPRPTAAPRVQVAGSGSELPLPPRRMPAPPPAAVAGGGTNSVAASTPVIALPTSPSATMSVFPVNLHAGLFPGAGVPGLLPRDVGVSTAQGDALSVVEQEIAALRANNEELRKRIAGHEDNQAALAGRLAAVETGSSASPGVGGLTQVDLTAVQGRLVSLADRLERVETTSALWKWLFWSSILVLAGAFLRNWWNRLPYLKVCRKERGLLDRSIDASTSVRQRLEEQRRLAAAEARELAGVVADIGRARAAVTIKTRELTGVVAHAEAVVAAFGEVLSRLDQRGWPEGVVPLRPSAPAAA